MSVALRTFLLFEAVLLPRYYMQSDPSAMQDGLTPLLAATDCADLAMVQCLVDHGANVEAQDTVRILYL